MPVTEKVNLYAKLRGRAPASLPRANRILEVAYLDVVVRPTVPLKMGSYVAIYTLARDALPHPLLIPTTAATGGYVARPAGIEGPIISIRTTELAVTELVVRNDVRYSLVEHAYLSVKHEQGVTVHLDLWRRLGRTLLLPLLPHTRHVPLESNVKITHWVETREDQASWNSRRDGGGAWTEDREGEVLESAEDNLSDDDSHEEEETL